MTYISRLMQRIKLVSALLLSFTLALNSLLLGVANAQTLDTESPLIEHDVLGTGTAGETQVFSAVITDDNSVESVDFYYRIGTTGEFAVVELSKGEKDTYSTEVGTKAEEAITIQYYFQAVDVAGNQISRGLPFSPLVREIVLPVSADVAPVPDPGQGGSTEPKKSNTLLYVLGGLLVVGLAAAAAGGSSNGPDDGGTCTGNCSVTFTISPP